MCLLCPIHFRRDRLSGNLLVGVTIFLERRFVVMRYLLLTSLAVSDFLSLFLIELFSISKAGQDIMLNMRYFHFYTILHVIAVSC